jgi:hypothetical protein
MPKKLRRDLKAVCANCLWWDQKGLQEAAPVESVVIRSASEEGRGYCRLHSPLPLMNHNWPMTKPIDWCAEWDSNEQ